MTGAIVIAEPESRGSHGLASSSVFKSAAQSGWLAGVELLGMSVFARLIRDLSRTGVLAEIVVLADKALAIHSGAAPEASFQTTSDVWRSVRKTLRNVQEKGWDDVLIVRAGAYVEFDLADVLRVHRSSGEAVTRVCDQNGPLDFWVVTPNLLPAEIGDPRSALSGASALYQVRGYVNLLQNMHDLRRLVSDGLSARCRFRPQAPEVRSSVWIGEGAQVARGARIVAPAFIGRETKISEQCLITRCTSVESGSHVDYGTVVEDSSILPGTYVGIGIDLTHSVANGTHLVNLRHGVALEIADPVVLRPVRQSRRRAEGDRSFLYDLRRKQAFFSPAEQSRR